MLEASLMHIPSIMSVLTKWNARIRKQVVFCVLRSEQAAHSSIWIAGSGSHWIGRLDGSTKVFFVISCCLHQSDSVAGCA